MLGERAGKMPRQTFVRTFDLLTSQHSRIDQVGKYSWIKKMASDRLIGGLIDGIQEREYLYAVV